MDRMFLEISNVSKTFPGVKALQNVHFDIYPGEVHALVGENGGFGRGLRAGGCF